METETKGINIIFLDIDGVLNCSSTKQRFDGLVGVDPNKIRLLKKIVDATGAKLVLSSTWRDGWAAKNHFMDTWQVGLFDYLVEELAKEGLSLLSKTPQSDPVFPHRGKEIKKWLDKWGGEPIKNYIILDDDVFDITDTNLHRGHIIETSYRRGLQPGAVKMAIQMLNKR